MTIACNDNTTYQYTGEGDWGGNCPTDPTCGYGCAEAEQGDISDTSKQ